MKKNESTEKSFADRVWEELEGKQIEMFSLPGQILRDHVERLTVAPNQLTLKPKSASVIVAVEKLIGNKYQLTMTNNGYIVLSVPNVEG